MIRGFPEMMKKARKSLNISYFTLSERTNISISNLKRYENGLVEPSAIKFLKICKSLELDPKKFL